MRSFKKIIIIFILLLAYEIIFSFMLEPITYDYFLEKDLDRLRESNRNPEMVLIGNSRVMMDFIPSVMEEEMDTPLCILNAGTGSQMPWGSYYYLKDLIKRYPIKYAVMGLDYSTFLNMDTRVPKRDLVVIDRVKSPMVKLEYITEILEPKEYPLLLKSYRYREGLDSVPENLQSKLSRSYRNGKDERKPSHYENMGYIYSEEKGVSHTGIYGAEEWNRQDVSPLAMKYLDKTYNLCKENNITLYLVVPPFAFSSIYNMDSYQDCFDYFKEYAQENKIPYCDLNLIKNRTKDLPDSMLSDGDHLGYNGARFISRLYAEILNNEMNGEDAAGFFYSSVEEMKEDIDGVIACDFKTEPHKKEGDRMIFARSIHENGIFLEFEYWVCPENMDNEWIKLQDYSEKSECLLPAKYLEKDITIRVNCREKGSSSLWDAQIERTRSPEM